MQPPSDEKAKALGVRAAFVAGHPSGAQLAEIAKIIDSGKLAPVIDRILPLSEVRRAHELSKSGHTHGKIVLRISNGNGTTTVMIRGFKSSRIREEFANFSEYLRHSENTIMRLFPRRAVSQNSTGIRCADTPVNERRSKIMKALPGTLQEGGASFASRRTGL